MTKRDDRRKSEDEKVKKTMPAWKRALHEVVYEAETPAGRAFDLTLFVLIIGSVIAVILESVASLRAEHGSVLRAAEWMFTILFTIEYFLRIISSANPTRYMCSFFGVIDLLSIVPTYLSLGLEGTQSLLVVRCLRLLRVFRVLKLARLSVEAETLWTAVKASRYKIGVFVGVVFTISIIMGTIMYVVEGAAHKISDIPTGIYWALSTVSTVGYGDIVPVTALGRCITSVLMILGYGLIAVPTGIVSVELAHASRLAVSTNSCPACHKEGHDLDAVYCRFCGGRL